MIKKAINILIEIINTVLEFLHLPSIPKLTYIPGNSLAFLGEKERGRND
jgi:hypothetical protein